MAFTSKYGYKALTDIDVDVFMIKKGEVVIFESKKSELYINGVWFASKNSGFMNDNFELIYENCFNCDKTINYETDDQWTVKYINEVGDLKFGKCCSKECCQEIVNKYSNIHIRRYEDTINQCFQKQNRIEKKDDKK